ncbi:sensor histidine kinase [Thermocoleostomius sinensis]|uniref:Circadian input-output histidine kinase CikA n=1 Tax=Thermocoleostomius sinensis A174 TaxID=2016057 RepID=A0A9E9C9H7_9CYAN|nr:sensor histidine kinase [Thermocoleostomius sinensis]WAL59597.1 sensor histidine kinase [Thermocoleostomius sinensis A174]
MDFSQTLTQRSETIVDRWIEAVCQDHRIESTRELTFKSIRDSLPSVLTALSTVLSDRETSDLQTLVQASLKHGQIRAEQGFEPSEIAEEYRLLRFVIFSVLEDELLKATPTEMLRAVRLIDTVIDEAIARCFESYTQGRIQELEQLQSQLRLTNQELTRLVRASKDNLSQLAHELKTPLTSIIGYADLFLRQQRQQSDLQVRSPNLESIERVLMSGRLLLRLINDTLEMSRCGTGTMKLQLAETNVRELIQLTVDMIEPLARSKNLTLIVDCDRSPDYIFTDSLRLQQILTNLLGNAIRYSNAGTVRLTCQTVSPNQWSISIGDDGIGIPLEEQTTIFEPYIRTEAAQSQTADGTGLGLAITSRLVALMQGQIEVQSQPGQGSTFTVTLPIDLSAIVNLN